MWRLTDYVGQIILGVAVWPMVQVFYIGAQSKMQVECFVGIGARPIMQVFFWSLHLDDCASLLFLGIGTHTTMPVCFYVNDVWPIMQVILFVEIGFWPILEI